jgi:translation initiation factor IF-2
VHTQSPPHSSDFGPSPPAPSPLPLPFTQVKAIFGTGKKRVAGCYVESGKLTKGSMIEVTRGSGKDKSVVFTGKLASLRRIKDTVDEVSLPLLAREGACNADSSCPGAGGECCYWLVCL